MLTREGLLSRRHRAATLFTILGMGIIFATDFLTPLGFAHGTLYILCILLAALTRDRHFVIIIAAVAIVLTAVGAAVSLRGWH